MTESRNISSLYLDLLKYDFPTFIGRTVATVDPATRYRINWHVELIAEYLEACRRGEITRLIINMPPRSLKSICVSVAWPAWILGHSPESRIMAASYASSLSVKHSLDCRTVLRSAWYHRIFPGVKLTRDQNEKFKFMTTRRGFRFSTSVGGSTTGEGGNFLIIDDPISPAQAQNAHWREFVNHWFDHTFASRLNDKEKGVIVLVMQRLHEQDLTGYLLAKGGWRHLCLPAIADAPEDHRFGNVRKQRVAGELLHEEREGAASIARAKIELGSAAFAAQYQQKPLSEESALVKDWWFKRYQTPPEPERIIQSWDTAIKSSNTHDASVCLTFGEWQGKSYLLAADVMRLEYPDLKRACFALAEKWRPEAVLIEDKASGQQLLQDGRRETSLPFIARMPKGNKVTRFAAVCALMEAGRLVLPEQSGWLADFEAELFAFPNSFHDDQVDALTQYLDWIRGSNWAKLRIRSV